VSSGVCTECPTAPALDVEGSETAEEIGSTSSRDELLNKVSTEEELLAILDKFRDFIDASPPTFSSVSDFPKGVITTEPTGSVKIYYAWEPPQIIKDKYSVLMLKFTDPSEKISNQKIDYTISIRNGTNSEFQKYGSTSTGVDLKIIDENTFPGASTISPVDYDVIITIASIDNIQVDEYTTPLKVNVVSQNP
jgi:hypothetical protein